jgi:NADH-quinone oxidoreductase subunit J
MNLNKFLKQVINYINMNLEYFLFFLFSTFAILSAISVISSQNPVHSVLFLILAFCNSAAILLAMGVEFLGLIFIVVYVGAIAVLFLFVVMMLNVKMSHKSSGLYSLMPVGGFVGLTLFFELGLVLKQSNFSSLSNIGNYVYTDWLQFDSINNLEAFGQVLYTYYVYYFLLAGVILLIAILGAIVLTMQVQTNVKRQRIYEQVARDFSRAIFLSTKL